MIKKYILVLIQTTTRPLLFCKRNDQKINRFRTAQQHRPSSRTENLWWFFFSIRDSTKSIVSQLCNDIYQSLLQRSNETHCRLITKPLVKQNFLGIVFLDEYRSRQPKRIELNLHIAGRTTRAREYLLYIFLLFFFDTFSKRPLKTNRKKAQQTQASKLKMNRRFFSTTSSLRIIDDARTAIKMIESGNNVWVQGHSAVPSRLINGLVERSSELRGVQLYHLLTQGGDFFFALFNRHFNLKIFSIMFLRCTVCKRRISTIVFHKLHFRRSKRATGCQHRPSSVRPDFSESSGKVISFWTSAFGCCIDSCFTTRQSWLLFAWDVDWSNRNRNQLCSSRRCTNQSQHATNSRWRHYSY